MRVRHKSPREKIVTAYLASGRLVQLPGPVVPARWNYHVVYPAHRRLRPAAQTVVDWLLQAAAANFPAPTTSPAGTHL